MDTMFPPKYICFDLPESAITTAKTMREETRKGGLVGSYKWEGAKVRSKLGLPHFLLLLFYCAGPLV